MFSGLADILFFAIFAAFIAHRVYTVLGRKDFDASEQVKEKQRKQESKPENVVDFLGNHPQNNQTIELSPSDFVDETQEDTKRYGEKLATKMGELRKSDPSFNAEDFLKGAGKAFEMVIKAFAQGDRRTLKSLLSRDVYEGFVSAIEIREQKEQTRETTLVAITSSNIADIKLLKRSVKIVVAFVSEQVNILKDKDGKVIEGGSSVVDEISDEWTFARSLTSSNPNWQLVETH